MTRDGHIAAPTEAKDIKIYDILEFFFREIAEFHGLDPEQIREKCREYGVTDILSGYASEAERDFLSAYSLFETREKDPQAAFESYFSYKDMEKKEEETRTRSLAMFQEPVHRYELEAAAAIHDILYFDDDDIGGS